MDAKTANKYKGKRLIFWCDCPVCQKTTAHFKPRETCSARCQRKLDTAREHIKKGKYATDKDIVKIDGADFTVLITNCRANLMARKPESYHYVLRDQRTAEYFEVRDLSEPLKTGVDYNGLTDRNPTSTPVIDKYIKDFQEGDR